MTSKKLAIIGLTIIVLALGGMYSRHFTIVSYPLILLTLVFLIPYVHDTFVGKQTKTMRWIGLIGSLLLTFYVGIQSPQIPGKIWIVAVGVGFLIPWVVHLLRN